MDKDRREHARRRSVRLKDYDYAQAGAYFITVCTIRKECVFGAIIDGEISLSDKGVIASERWQSIPIHFPHIELDEFILMPNHVHGIIVIDRPVGARHAVPLENATHTGQVETFGSPTIGSIPTVIRSYKAAVTKELNMRSRSQGVSVWQRGFYEHVIRDADALDKIREYIRYNPTKWDEDKYYVD